MVRNDTFFGLSLPPVEVDSGRGTRECGFRTKGRSEMRHLNSGTWYVVRGTWYVVRGTWYVVRGRQSLDGRGCGALKLRRSERYRRLESAWWRGTVVSLYLLTVIEGKSQVKSLNFV